ncbi:MAG: DMT family transporter [Candidatus Micrarchaeota archaeon]
MSESKGVFFAFLTALISGASVFVNGFVVKGFDPFVFTTLKNFGAAIFIVAAIFLFREMGNLRKLTLSQWKWLAIIGIIGGSIPFLMFFSGLSMIPAVKGSFLFRLLFIFSAVFAAIMLKERPSRNAIIGAAIFLIGNMFLLGGLDSLLSFGIGEMLVLGATVIWGFEYVLSKWVMQKTGLEPRMIAFGRMLIGTIVLFAFIGIAGKADYIATLTTIHWGWVAITSGFLFLFVSSWYSALKWAKATTATAILALGGPITTSLSYLFLGKAPSMNDAYGLLLIVAGVAVLVGYSQIAASGTFALNEIRKRFAWKA